MHSLNQQQCNKNQKIRIPALREIPHTKSQTKRHVVRHSSKGSNSLISSKSDVSVDAKYQWLISYNLSFSSHIENGVKINCKLLSWKCMNIRLRELVCVRVCILVRVCARILQGFRPNNIRSTIKLSFLADQRQIIDPKIEKKKKKAITSKVGQRRPKWNLDWFGTSEGNYGLDIKGAFATKFTCYSSRIIWKE